MINFQSIAKTASQPVFALGVFIFLLFSGSLLSHQILAQTKPNDSLYIARIISEKVRLNTIFDTQERDKLAMQFASEHAQDITAVLANPEFNNDANRDQVARLNDSFNKEVEAVKSRMSRFNTATKNPESKTGVTIEDEVIIADSVKDSHGIELSEGTSTRATTTLNENATANLNILVGTSSNKLATSSNLVEPSVADQILDEAKELFDKKDYNSALNKLKEVDEIIK